MNEHRSPRNTTTDDPLLRLIVAAGPHGIEEQERQGQAEVLASTTLPTSGPIAEMEELGFTFGPVVPGDDLFREATLPEGWSREGSDHAMHSYITDERGVRRVNVFYKAAFYDRRADMHLLNVGYDVGTHAIYGDDPITLNPALTSEELDDALGFAQNYLAQAADPATGHIYADRVPKAKALIAAIEAVS